MENKLKIYQKLLIIQQSVIGLGKDKKSFGFDYVTGTKVLEHIKPLMNEQGLLLKQEVISIENTRQDYATKNGSTSEMNSKVMMRFTWIDVQTGEKDENLFGANGQNAWDKGVGSALTYGERYFLLKYFHIATDEDDIDNPERKPEDTKSANPVTATLSETQFKQETQPKLEDQKAEMLKLLNSSVITEEERTNAILSLKTLTSEQIIKKIAGLKKEIKRREEIEASTA